VTFNGYNYKRTWQFKTMSKDEIVSVISTYLRQATVQRHSMSFKVLM